ncbi:MAG: hypothetical protein Q7T61_07690 [Caulobacter sp.]|nr:hypothetical protein [Caulobacter sp.]
MTLTEETERLQALIGGRVVRDATRTRLGGLMIRFTDTTILYVDGQPDGSPDLSVVGGPPEDDQ